METQFFRGRLGDDAERIDAPNGVTGAKFRLAVNDSYLSREGEWVKRETVWIPCEAWRKTAEALLPVLTKGCGVVVVGKWRAQTWTAEDGSKRSKNVFHVEGVGVDVEAMEIKGVAKRTAAEQPAQPAPVAPAEEHAASPFDAAASTLAGDAG